MENQIEELNRIYINELNKFLSKIDFDTIGKVKEKIINSICDYFDNSFKGILSYDKNVIIEKIEEVFNYGFTRTRATIEEIGFIKYDSVETFDNKNRLNEEQRKNLISKFDSNNPSNNFSDLEDRITTLITESLSRRNYDNKNYENNHFKIKTSILKYVENQKINMLNTIKFDLEKQNQELERIILSEWKSILTTVDRKIDESSREDLMLSPILTDSTYETSANILEPILDVEDNNYQGLPGNVLK